MSGLAAGLVYCVALAALLAAAARFAESALRGVGRPGRWTWAVGLGLSVAIPLAAWLGLRAWTAPLPAVPDAVVLALPELTSGFTRRAGVEWGVVLGVVWCVASLGVGLRLALGIGRLRAAMRGWRQERVSGVDVLVTENVGPAVFGLRRASILVPSWALAIQEDLRTLMLLHEREHVRAGDPWLLAGALGVVVLMPWNPAIWYQLHRLRLAVEMDCDARVLRRVPDRRRYGRLLLEVGRHRASPLAVLALSAPVTFLERRIHAFTRRAGPHAARRALALGGAAFCLGSLAVCMRDPISPQPDAVANAAVAQSSRPIFTPYSVKPALRNPAQVAAALQRRYPPLLRDAGIEGTTIMWFYIDEGGRVVKTQVHESSGYEALDAAAQHVAALMEFSPALNRDQPVPVWVQIPIRFAAREPADAGSGDATGPTYSSERLSPTATAPGGPHFTPYTVKPQLRNAADVSRMLQTSYPPLLRDAGIGGTATLWFHIAADGGVDDVRVNTSSGHEALDQAALHVARGMTFTPARNGDEPVAVWVQIPITFSSR